MPTLLKVKAGWAHGEPKTQRVVANFYIGPADGTLQLSGHLLLSVGEWQVLGAALLASPTATNGFLQVEIVEDPLAAPKA